MSENKKAQPGDTVELKDKEIGFTDPDTGFDISRDQQKQLGKTIGDRTHAAIVSGGLLIVSSASKKAKEPAKTDDKTGEGSDGK